MMFDIYDLTFCFIGLLLIAYWWRISGQKTHALNRAKQHCEKSGLQFLDQTLVFIRHRIEKDARGKRHLCRFYEFDFSIEGEERRKGEIMLSGFYVIRIVLEKDYLEVTEF
jgi:hypothetical protein